MWNEGAIGVPAGEGQKIAHYWVKAFEEPSKQYGICGGKISKLMIKIDGVIVANYDRGWDIEPDEDDFPTWVAMSILLKEYN